MARPRSLTPPSCCCLVSHRLWEVCGEVVLHHVEGGGGRLVASDGRDRVRPGRDDDRLVVVLHREGREGRFETMALNFKISICKHLY